MTRSRTLVDATPGSAPMADGDIVRLNGYLSAVAGLPRVPTRLGRAAGTLIGAERVVERDCPRMRVCLFVSGVNPVGDTKWMVLHGTGMADDP